MIIDSVDLPDLRDVAVDDGTRIEAVSTDGELTVLRLVSRPGAAVTVRLEVALGAAAGYWHPGALSWRTLPADWAGRTSTSLVSWSPVGCLHDAAGRSRFTWAADELVDELEITFGISEEHKTFVVAVRGRPRGGVHRVDLALGFAERPLAEAVGRAAAWQADRLATTPLAVPEVARRPVYSTWYTFTQDVSEASVEEEATLAAELGCGSVFLDDGWQRFGHGRGYAGCGDWVPDQAKFPDLARFSRQIADRGLGLVLWLAPLLLGREADAYGSLRSSAPQEVPPLACQVLDPRIREVREYVAEVCARLVLDHELAGLKIDFLDQAMVYRGTPSAGDLDDVGEAMGELLAGVRRRLSDAGRGDAAFEFRQPYVSPAIGAYGQILRAGDCPGDAVVNRRSTVDARLLAVGQVVHGDMMMWGPDGGAEAVAQQLYACWFAVPQISMRLRDLAPAQSEALGGLLRLWQDLAPVSLDGTLTVEGSERSYDLVRADHPGLGRSVIGRYAPVVIDLDGAGEVTILNATGSRSVVLRVAAMIMITGGVVRGPSGAPVRTVDGPRGQGLWEVAVPPYGSVTLTAEIAPSRS